MRVLLSFILIIYIIVSPLAVNAENQPGRIMFVLDASGSMWGQINDKTKISIARNVIEDILQSMDKSVELGIVAYGHRHKSKCDDIEILAETGSANASDIINLIKKIQPKGKTPLTAAVKQAALSMRYTQQRATVILISDGLETCDMNPCAVGAELSMSGKDFTTHVIGFDIKEGEQKELKCLADNTGGLYLPANDTRSLHQALLQTVASAQEKPREIIEQPGDTSLIAAVSVEAGSSFPVEWEGPNSRGDWITIVKQEAHEGAYLHYAYTKYGSPVEMVAPDQAGQYQLRYMFGHKNKVLSTRLIKVTEAKADLAFFDLQPAGSSFAVQWSGPDNKRDYITVVPIGASAYQYMSYEYTAKGSPLTLLAPDEAGEYEVRYIMGQSKHVLSAKPLKVTEVNAKLTVPAEIQIGEHFSVNWFGPNNKNDFITIVAAGASEGAYASYEYTSSGNPVVLVAAGTLGEYEVRYVQGQTKSTLALEKVMVKAVSATLTVPPTLKVKQSFKVQWDGPNNKSDYITIVSKQSNNAHYASYAYTRFGNPAELSAPDVPGEYEVRYVLGGPKVVIGKAQVKVE